MEVNREDGFMITNKQKKTAVRVEKKWLKTDGSAFRNSNLPEIEVDLFKEGEPTTPIMTKKLTMFDNRGTFFTGLPLVNELDQAIKNTVKERWVQFGFDTATSNDNISSAVLIPEGGGDSYSASFTITT